MKILLCLMFLSTTLFADEPEKLTELKAIFEAEKAKALKPLVDKYVKALEHYKIEATKAGDLDSALAFKAELEIRAPVTEKEESSSVSKAQKRLKPTLLIKGAGTSRSWSGDRAMHYKERRFKAVRLQCLAEGDTQGTIHLECPDNERILIYSWTGRESQFRKRRESIKEYSDLQPLDVEISKYAMLNGPYAIHFKMTEGDGKFYIYQTGMEIVD